MLCFVAVPTRQMCTVKNKTGDTDREVSSGNGDRLHVEQRIHRGLKLKISVRTGLWTQRADI